MTSPSPNYVRDKEDFKKTKAEIFEKVNKKHATHQIGWEAEGKNLKKREYETKQFKKRKDKIKSKKKAHKRHKYNTDGEISQSRNSSNCSDSDGEERSRKKTKKSKKKKARHNRSSSSSSSSSNTSNRSDSDEEERSRKNIKKCKKKKARHNRSSSSSSNSSNEVHWIERKSTSLPLKRDTWMTESVILKTYSKEHINKKPNEQRQFEAYHPSQSNKELNPYWKTTGTGLPQFKKPEVDYDNEEKDSNKQIPLIYNNGSKCAKSWKKSSQTISIKSNESSLKICSTERELNAESINLNNHLTDQGMNELGAKIVKAEIMGNLQLAGELKQLLEKARKQHAEMKQDNKNKGEKQILLTQTNAIGNSRPLPHLAKVDSCGQRMSYLAYDDKYNLQQMFEKEKYTSAVQSNMEFANLTCKQKMLPDDFDDIFAEHDGKDNFAKAERRALQEAINDQQRIEKVLDDCKKCLNSPKMQKELMIEAGQNVYLALPWYIGLQAGHCLIVPIHHIICSTQLDEDVWVEVTTYRRALTQIFAAQNKDVIFYEIANNLHRRTHMAIHCIPIDRQNSDMAPFYFRKAIEESEREWSVNKQLVLLRDNSLLNCIPKGLPYFWVNFGMDSGFAHVIEDEDRFPETFAEEIIGGMLNLEANKWRKRQKEQNITPKLKMLRDSLKRNATVQF